MKTNLLNLAAIFSIAIFSNNVFAQSTATATATATIVTPISITRTADMNFGNIAINSSLGTVALDTDGARTTIGGVTLPAINGTVTAAAFTVNGEGAYTYAITLPNSDYTITNGSSVNMIVNTFVSIPSGTGLLALGTQELKVGATLNVEANQAAGSYTNATGFNVTVNYN